ncbi:hypothetical protein AB3329_07905 [Streptococcus sp. H31]|uniref:hypothetical protein n=1 Tax=Streptococcus huangxiaojuni TaxID=3237239 RepID=UPI0034A4E2C9
MSKSKQVRQIFDELDPLNHGITVAIHQNKDECIALFHMPKQSEAKNFDFIGWNDDVRNRTNYHSKNDLLDAYVDKVRKVTNDWICVELLPF